MMALTVTSATQSPDGSVVIIGTEFTKTTTFVHVDGVPVQFEWLSSTKIIAECNADDAVSVTVEKAGVSVTADITDQEAPVTDVPAPEPTIETPEQSAITAGTWPNPIDGFRAAVHGVALTGLIPVGDEKTPYPTGTQLGAGKKFWLQQGYYKSATPT